MAEQVGATFGAALAAALKRKRMSQAALSKALDIDAGQVSRWVNDKTRPHLATVQRLEELLDAVLLDAFETSLPALELYVSAPITGLNPNRVAEHHTQVRGVVESLRDHVHSWYWPGESITSVDDLQAADLATENNLRRFEPAQAFLYLQFEEVEAPSGALVELGMALALRKKTTVIVREGLRTPFMLRGFQGVASKFRFLPEARIYSVRSVEEAGRLIARNGRPLLGLT